MKPKTENRKLPKEETVSCIGECLFEKCIQYKGSRSKDAAAGPIEAWTPNSVRFRIVSTAYCIFLTQTGDAACFFLGSFPFSF